VKLYPATRDCCPADVTYETALILRGLKGDRTDRAKRIFHRHGEAIFWHWHDQQVASPYLHAHLST
jgi:hypothetical protein